MSTKKTATAIFVISTLLQPILVFGASLNVNYIYDNNGQRIIETSAGSSSTYYPNKYYETKGQTNTKYIYVGDTLVGTVSNDINTGTTTLNYNHSDQLGSTNVVSDTSGNTQENLDYYPYGGQRIDSGTTTSAKQYIGERYDSTTGLNYLNARYYDGNKGKFISEDPMFWQTPKEYLKDPQQWNSYSYGGDNPIKNSDPDGKWYKELLTGQQSLSGFGNEVSQATQYMGNGWQGAMDHPYVAGATVGVAGGLAAYGAATVLTQAQVGINLGRLSSLPVDPRVDLAGKGFDNINKATGLTKNEAMQVIQDTGQSLVETRFNNLGNINTVSNVGNKVIRITTNPEATKIISAGVIKSTSKLTGYISSGAMQAVPIITSVAKNATKFIGNLMK